MLKEWLVDLIDWYAAYLHRSACEYNEQSKRWTDFAERIETGRWRKDNAKSG